MEFHILCGIPGSGKSTLVEKLTGFVISTDSIRRFLWQDESVVKHDKLVFDLAETIMSYLFSRTEDIIFDATNLTIERRKKYINLAKRYDATVTVHWVNCPLHIAIERNSRRDRKVPEMIIKSLYKSFQKPTIDEGMDLIKVYEENLSLSTIITPG